MNLAFALVVCWYAWLPPVEGTHPGFVFGPIFLLVLFPGSILSILAFVVVAALAPPRWLLIAALLVSWSGGAALSYVFWFSGVPNMLRALTKRRSGESAG